MAVNLPQLFTSGVHKVLVLDPSSSHLAYTIITLDFTKQLLAIEACGMVWTRDQFTKGQRYSYMQQAIRLLTQGLQDQIPEAIVTEAFFANPKQMMGSAVVPTINAFAEMAASEFKIPYQDMGATSWRGILGIKAVKDAKGKRDYKVPTANLVAQQVKLPSEIPSNITRKMRDMPNDVTDVLAIALAVGRHHDLNKVIQSNTAFYPFNWLEKLEKLSKEI
jgi:Holliday junction resolvasome RuvABC endonuclease subunit